MLLNLKPKDYDIATSARPDEVLQVFPGSQLVGAKFGVVLVKDGDRQVEVATFRSDGVYTDGRRPLDVSYVSDWRADSYRRDFTINALYMDPFSMEVRDHHMGRTDLADRIIRAVGSADERFLEDHLRMLRAIRFASRLRFIIEPETAGAIRQHAHKIQVIAVERIQQELNLILTQGRVGMAFSQMWTLGLLPQIFPEIAMLYGVEQPPEYHPEGCVLTHTLSALDQLQPDCSLTLALAVLLHDIGKPSTFARGLDGRIKFSGHADVSAALSDVLLQSLRYSNDVIDQVKALVANHMRIGVLGDMRLSKQKKLIAEPWFDDLLELHRIDCIASNGDLTSYHAAGQIRRAIPPEELKPERLVTGSDLIALGLTPGPAFKTVLDRVEELQLDSQLTSKEEALDWIRNHYHTPTGLWI